MKKMNNLFKKICLWSLVVTMASCDFLDTKPYDFVAPETFYQNEKIVQWPWLEYIIPW